MNNLHLILKQSDVIMVGVFLGTKHAGIYGIATRVAMLLGKLLRDHEALRDMGRRARDVALPGAAARIAERLLAIGGGV